MSLLDDSGMHLLIWPKLTLTDCDGQFAEDSLTNPKYLILRTSYRQRAPCLQKNSVCLWWTFCRRLLNYSQVSRLRTGYKQRAPCLQKNGVCLWWTFCRRLLNYSQVSMFKTGYKQRTPCLQKNGVCLWWTFCRRLLNYSQVSRLRTGYRQRAPCLQKNAGPSIRCATSPHFPKRDLVSGSKNTNDKKKTKHSDYSPYWPPHC